MCILTEPRVAGPVNYFVTFNDSVSGVQRRRDPRDSNSLRSQCCACGIMGWLFWYTFRSVLSNFVRHWSGTKFVKGLHHNCVLSVSPRLQ